MLENFYKELEENFFNKASVKNSNDNYNEISKVITTKVLTMPVTKKINTELFEIDNDCDFISIGGKKYVIEDFFSKEMIKNRDKKTLEMIFYSIGLNPKEYLATG